MSLTYDNGIIAADFIIGSAAWKFAITSGLEVPISSLDMLQENPPGSVETDLEQFLKIAKTSSCLAKAAEEFDATPACRVSSRILLHSWSAFPWPEAAFGDGEKSVWEQSLCH